jgi:uncharacterized protein (DUF849 family)
MQPKVIITCAVTGAGDTVGKHPAIPVTPEQIANSALQAASAGATIVHCHVREPSTGKGSRKVEYYAEVMERIRARNKEVIINLTAGMGGDVEIGSGATPLDFGPGTDCVGPEERLIHVKELRPELCTLDCGTLNFGDGNAIVVQTPTQLPEGAIWAAFGIGRNEFPAVAQAVLLGGHVRVGLEDNLWLERGVHASNGTLVEKAVKIIELLGTKVASPDEGREILKLKKRN